MLNLFQHLTLQHKLLPFQNQTLKLVQGDITIVMEFSSENKSSFKKRNVTLNIKERFVMLNLFQHLTLQHQITSIPKSDPETSSW